VRQVAYNPTFTQEDPIGLAGGLNLYGFAGGDPINFWDPFGLRDTTFADNAARELVQGCVQASTECADWIGRMADDELRTYSFETGPTSTDELGNVKYTQTQDGGFITGAAITVESDVGRVSSYGVSQLDVLTHEIGHTLGTIALRMVEWPQPSFARCGQPCANRFMNAFRSDVGKTALTNWPPTRR
jgi:hypothetical protein